MDEEGNVTEDVGATSYNLQIYSQKGGIASRETRGPIQMMTLLKAYGWRSMSRLMKWPRSLEALR